MCYSTWLYVSSGDLNSSPSLTLYTKDLTHYGVSSVLLTSPTGLFLLGAFTLSTCFRMIFELFETFLGAFSLSKVAAPESSDPQSTLMRVHPGAKR